jgi:signal peptide peptidase SppA
MPEHEKDQPLSETGRNALATLAKLVETEGRSWAIMPEILVGLSKLRGQAGDLADFESDFLASDAGIEAQRRTRGQLVSKGDVAVIPLKGILMPNASFLAMLLGLGSGLKSFRRNVKEAVGDDEIGAIVIDIDSPGGLVDQIPEAAAELRAAREQKPVIAVANTLAASAAYWLAAQADEVVITPSGEIGSIGVYTEHRDISVALENAGINPTLISAGKYKVETNPYEPLTDSAAEAMQEGVDYFYGLFVSDVAKGRDDTVNAVKNGYGEGRVLNAKRAVGEKLADRIDTLDATIARLMGRPGSGAGRRAEANPPSEDEVEPAETTALTQSDLERVFDASFGEGDKEVVH